MGEAQRGVRGFVYDGHGRPLENVAMKVKGRDAPFQTTKHGEFWRILLPGYYRLEVGATPSSLHLFLEPSCSHMMSFH